MPVETKVIRSDNPESAKITSEVLKRGGVVVYPTETLYGIAVRALDKAASEKVFEIKGRPKNMPIPILVKDISMAETVAEINDTAVKLGGAFWPGALSLIVKEKGLLPEVITAGTGKVAVRISKNPFVKSLFGHFDEPITSTSANMSGGENITRFGDLEREFSGRVDLIIDSGNIPPSLGSTIVDVTVNPPKIARAGDIKEEEIMEQL